MQRPRLVTVALKQLNLRSCRKVVAYCPWPLLMSWWWHLCISDPGACRAPLTDQKAQNQLFL